MQLTPLSQRPRGQWDDRVARAEAHPRTVRCQGRSRAAGGPRRHPTRRARSAALSGVMICTPLTHKMRCARPLGTPIRVAWKPSLTDRRALGLWPRDAPSCHASGSGSSVGFERAGLFLFATGDKHRTRRGSSDRSHCRSLVTVTDAPILSKPLRTDCKFPSPVSIMKITAALFWKQDGV